MSSTFDRTGKTPAGTKEAVMNKSADSELISHNKKVNDFFNSRYSWWEGVYDRSLPKKFFSYEMIRRKELLIDLLSKYVARGKPARVLECGCGYGDIIKELGSLKCQLTGIDINLRHLTFAKNNINEQVNWFQADVENLPFRDGYFDLVYCVGVLSYLRDDKNAVSEMARVVKDGGMVIISVPNIFMLNKFFDPYYYFVWLPGNILKKIALSKKIVDKKNFCTDMIRRYSFSKISNEFEKHGMVEIDSVNVSFGPLTFWRNEVLSLSQSINISERLRKVGEKKSFNFLRYFANHWITCLSK
jgi:ubiquinone/menaquinone biosynthesis C-methylase UbiE